MGLKSWLIKKVVRENTYEILIGVWDGGWRFLQEIFNRMKSYVSTGWKSKLKVSGHHTDADNAEEQMDKKYSKRGSQSADLFNPSNRK